MTETETKYDAPAGAGLPDLGSLPRVAATSRPDAQRVWKQASRRRYRRWMR